MPNIGQVTGYWKEREADRFNKQTKVDKLIRRARSCRTFDGLEVVGNDARDAGLWHPVAVTFGECNARLRGRHIPALYRKGDNTLIISDDKVTTMPWIRSRALCGEGWTYAGPASSD